MDVPLLALPAEEIKPAEGHEHEGGPAQQRDETQRAPQERGAGRPIAHQRVVGKVIRVGIGPAGPRGDCSPSGPSKEGRQRPELRRVGNIAGREAAVRAGSREVRGPQRELASIRGGLGPREGEGLRPRVIPVRFQLLRNLPLECHAFGRSERDQGTAVPVHRQPLAGVHGQRVQVGRREVRSKIGPVAPDGPVVHQAVLQEDRLPRPDVVAREDRLARGPDHPVRDRRRVRVGAHRLPDQHAKPQYQDQDDRVSPPGGKLLVGLHVPPLQQSKRS